MRRVKCHDCGKLYNYDADDFCPYCGAYTQPPRTMRVNADGTVVRVDGLNEENHAGSFLHEERHREDAERRKTGLSKSQKNVRVSEVQTAVPSAEAGKKREKKQSFPIGWIILFLIILFNLLDNLFN